MYLDSDNCSLQRMCVYDMSYLALAGGKWLAKLVVLAVVFIGCIILSVI